jgi:DinB superfamily
MMGVGVKMQSLLQLRVLIDRLPARLRELPDAQVQRKPSLSKWSLKEELGHLLDSAANNHQRIVRAQLENNPAMPGHDGDEWVKLHRYQERDWSSLIAIWADLNRQLLAAAEAVPDLAWSRTCTIADSAPLALKFVFDGYVDHMLQHLRHMGVETHELVSASVGAS